MSFSAHIDNKKKDILVLGPTQGLEHILTAEKMYSIDFTVAKKKFCLSLHYNGASSYLFFSMIQKFTNLKQKILKLCLGNISKDWSIDNMKKNQDLMVYDFSVHYDSADVDDLRDIHNYLMKKNDMV